MKTSVRAVAVVSDPAYLRFAFAGSLVLILAACTPEQTVISRDYGICATIPGAGAEYQAAEDYEKTSFLLAGEAARIGVSLYPTHPAELMVTRHRAIREGKTLPSDHALRLIDVHDAGSVQVVAIINSGDRHRPALYVEGFAAGASAAELSDIIDSVARCR